MNTDTAAALSPLLVDAAEAARLCGVSRATWFGWQAAGMIPRPVIRRGRVRRWAVSEITAWLNAGAPSAERWQLLRKARGNESFGPA